MQPYAGNDRKRQQQVRHEPGRATRPTAGGALFVVLDEPATTTRNAMTAASAALLSNSFSGTARRARARRGRGYRHGFAGSRGNAMAAATRRGGACTVAAKPERADVAAELRSAAKPTQATRNAAAGAVLTTSSSSGSSLLAETTAAARHLLVLDHERRRRAPSTCEHIAMTGSRRNFGGRFN